jgi:aryl-phospho-beta-D-glucosidase BglC (GH1 family)
VAKCISPFENIYLSRLVNSWKSTNFLELTICDVKHITATSITFNYRPSESNSLFVDKKRLGGNFKGEYTTFVVGPEMDSFVYKFINELAYYINSASIQLLREGTGREIPEA